MPPANAQRLAVAALPGALVDFLFFRLLCDLGFDLATSHIASFAVAAVFSHCLLAGWIAVIGESQVAWRRYSFLRACVVWLLALFLRGGVLDLLTDTWNASPDVAVGVAIATSAAVGYLGTAHYVLPGSLHAKVLCLALYALALRMVFLGAVDLLPEEAYYWNYSQHLAIGYLDHPPMVAWLIRLGTSVFGDTEFGVRLSAYCCWAIAGVFCFLLTRDLYGRTPAWIAVLLFATLPFFFTIGFFMTPDAPLTAAWAGTLYFLSQTLLRSRAGVWWAAGLCLGLGLLSKYTIALLGPAALLYMLMNPDARRWLRRPQPYAALLIAAVLFLPVVVWNAQNEWASFIFQGSRRAAGPMHFYLFVLVASVLVLLSPAGMAGAFKALLPRRAGDPGWLFASVFTLVPLSVFIFFSLFHEVKLNWTGPLWLALLPKVAEQIATMRSGFLRRAWTPTFIVLLLGYGAGLHYVTLGLPGVGYPSNFAALPFAWKEFGRLAAEIEEDVEDLVMDEPLRIGMDKYFLSSLMAFYDPVDNDGAENSGGRGVVVLGADSLMYDVWFPARRQEGRSIILFALNPEDLSKPAIEARFALMEPVREQAIYKRSTLVGRFYYRIGHNYRPG